MFEHLDALFANLDKKEQHYAKILHARIEHWIAELNKLSGKTFDLKSPEAPKQAKPVKAAEKESE